LSAIQEELPHSEEDRNLQRHSSNKIRSDVEKTRSGDFAVRSFRIARSDFDQLQKEARARDVSVNLVVEEALRRHVQYDRVVKKFRTINLSSFNLKLLSEAISEDKIIEIAESVANQPFIRDWPFVLDAAGENSALGILNTMKMIAKYDAYDVSEIEIDSKKIVFFAHDAGRHWSLFFATLWKTMFELAGIKIKARIDDRAAIFEFEKSQLV